MRGENLGIACSKAPLIGDRWAYSISFSTLIVGAENLTTFWNWPQTVQRVIFILVVPGALVGLNLFGVLVRDFPLFSVPNVY